MQIRNNNSKPKGVTTSQVNPLDFYAEESLLGSLLYNDKVPRNIAQLFTYVSPADFEREDHSILFGAISSAFGSTGNIDVLDIIKLIRRDLVKGRIEIDLLAKLSTIISFEIGIDELFIEIKKKSFCRQLENCLQLESSKLADCLNPIKWLDSHIDSLNRLRTDYETQFNTSFLKL